MQVREIWEKVASDDVRQCLGIGVLLLVSLHPVLHLRPALVDGTDYAAPSLDLESALALGPDEV